MPNKNDKVLISIAAAAGIGVTTFLLLKYRKNLISKLSSAKNHIVHDVIKVPRKLDIHIINDVNDCSKILKIIKEHSEKYCVLGFDCEWVTVNNERRKVALLQLATAEGLCALFRLCKFSSIPLELRAILEDPDVIKTGVACNEDGSNLLQDYSIKLNGAFDLRFLALLASHKAEGLGKLSKKVLNIELDKNWKISCSDWEAPTLTPTQIDYAAKDAHVAVEIFKNLYSSIRKNADDKHSILQFCDNYTDISFKNKLAQMNLDNTEDSKITEKQLLNYSKKQKDINKILKRAYSIRSKPLYDNCYLEAPDGELLSTIEKSKAEWYIKKGLGVEIEKEPLRVRLNFEPAGRAVGEAGEYYKSVKENICVVCGKDHDLIRKNVIPHEYRKYFPNIMKDKTSHDVVLLCLHCHHISNMSDLRVRRMLEEKCDAPMIQLPENDEELRKYKSIQKAAKALFRNASTIPEKRKKELEAKIKEAYPNDELNEDFLHYISFSDNPEPIQKTPHGKKVVDYYREKEGIIELEKIYRQHFLAAMEPKYMPKMWNVNHTADRLEIRAQENRITAEELKVAGLPSIQINNAPKVENTVDDEGDCVSVSSFYSAAGTADNMSRKYDQSITDDEKYYSDATFGSYYESCANSMFDPSEFKSFEGSLNEKLDNYSDSSTIGSDNDVDVSGFSQEEDSDTEVEEDNQQKKL